MTTRHPHRVAQLHTSGVHVATFDKLFGEFCSEVELEHIVAEDLLLEAQRLGPSNPLVVERVQKVMIQAGHSAASVVVCTCSTIGGAAEHTDSGGLFKVMRIDRAMADRAVILGPRILIVAALGSTLTPTYLLVEESANALGLEVKIETLHVKSAWKFFLEDQQNHYIEEIVSGVKRGLGEANVVILAQASMAQAAGALAGIGVEVLSSPQLGVERIMEALRNIDTVRADSAGPFTHETKNCTVHRRPGRYRPRTGVKTAG